MSNIFVCGMGIGTVFAGLVTLVVICYIISAACKVVGKSEPTEVKKQAPVAVSSEIANKGEIVAACCAAIAEELGEDVKNIRVVSFKRA